MRCLEVAYRVIPCCKNCEFNAAGVCNMPPHVYFSEDGPFVSGIAIKNCESLCIHWSPSLEAVLRTLEFICNTPSPQKSPDPERKKTGGKKEPVKVDDYFINQIDLYLSGRIKADDAAQTLGISRSTFYAKAVKRKQEIQA